MSATTMSTYAPRRLSRPGLAVVVTLHGAALWALTRLELISLPPPVAALSVSLLPAAEALPSRPRVEPPRPTPMAKATPPAQPARSVAIPVIAALTPAPEAPAAPPVEASTASSPAAAAPTPLPALIPAPPRFDANYLDNPAPPYPPISRRIGEQGRVVLRVQVAPGGLPAAIALVASSGSARLDQAAIDTVRRWIFIPARLGNEVIAAAVLVPIVFSLKD